MAEIIVAFIKNILPTTPRYLYTPHQFRIILRRYFIIIGKIYSSNVLIDTSKFNKGNTIYLLARYKKNRKNIAVVRRFLDEHEEILCTDPVNINSYKWHLIFN
jgi:hypothetical protein